MATINDLYKIFESRDCGACGFASCRTFARRLAVGKVKLEDCPILAKDMKLKEHAERLLREGITMGAKMIIKTEEGVTLIHPCITDKKLVTAETALTKTELKFGFLDFRAMISLFKFYPPFKNMKVSEELGVVKFDYQEKNIIVYSSGKVVVRRAKDKDDILNTVKLVSRVMWGSLICSCCGSTSVECASGACDDCVGRLCPVLAGGPPAEVTGESAKIASGSIFSRVPEESKKEFYQAIETFKKILDLIEDEKDLEEILKLIEEANTTAINYIVKTNQKEPATLGLLLLGISFDLEAAARAVFDLKRMKVKEISKKEITKKMLSDAFDAFLNWNFQKSENVKILYENFKNETSEEGLLIKKIASSAFYIARLLPKPLPG